MIVLGYKNIVVVNRLEMGIGIYYDDNNILLGGVLLLVIRIGRVIVVGGGDCKYLLDLISLLIVNEGGFDFIN
jgi:hypothetical protein